MPPLLTLPELRTRVETGLGDEALAGLLAAADAMIVERHGAHPTATPISYQMLPTNFWTILLPRRASSIAAVSDFTAWLQPPRARTDVILASGGWEAWAGDMGRFRRYAQLELVPHDDTELRRAVTASVVAAMLHHQPGIASDRVGEYSRTNADYLRALMTAMHPLDRLIVR